MATKTKAQIKAELLSLYNDAKAGSMSEDDFADGMASVIHEAVVSVITQLDLLVATDSLGGGVTLISGSGSVVP